MGKKALIVVLFLLMSFAHYNNFSLAAKDVDYFNEVINVTDGRVTEFGIRASFEIYEDGEGYCLQLLNKLHINNACISVIKEEKFYSVEFNNNGLKGYIENTSYDNHNVVTLNIVQYDSRNGLHELKNMIINAVGKAEDEVRYFEYLKAQINCNDKAKVNSEIAEVLKMNNASNIGTVEIDNGYSTVAYTRKYPVMKNDGKWIDFNYAVCSYSSGNYVIIGTPVIITTY